MLKLKPLASVLRRRVQCASLKVMTARPAIRTLSTLPPHQGSSTSSSPPPPLFAVEAPDGTCPEVDALEDQRVVNDLVAEEANHRLEQHLLEDHVDFYGPAQGPLHALHPPDLRPPTVVVDAQHLLAVSETDIQRTERDNYAKVATRLEDLHFGPYDTHATSPLEDPAHYAAVESPDGTPDDVVQHDLEEVEHLIDEAAATEDKAFVAKLHQQQAEAAQTFAVEAPDGTSDAMRDEDLHTVDAIIDTEARLHDPTVQAATQRRVQREMAQKIYAVDAPDGTSDAMDSEDQHAVEDWIAHAASHEDKDEIRRIHNETQDLLDTLGQISPKNPFDVTK